MKSDEYAADTTILPWQTSVPQELSLENIPIEDA